MLAVALSAMQSAGDLLLHIGAWQMMHWLSPITGAALLLVGPALWMYVVAIAAKPGRPGPQLRDMAPHAAPAALVGLTLAWDVAVQPQVTVVPPGFRTVEELVSLAPVAAQLLTYAAAIAWRVRALRPQLESEFSSLDRRSLSWLQAASAALAMLVLAWMATWSMSVAVSNVITNFLLALTVTVLGVFGVRQARVFAREASHPPPGAAAPPVATAAEVAEVAEASDGSTASPKYAKSTLAPEVANRLAQRLEAVMRQDKPFLEPDLSLASLAAQVDATPHQLSQVLSTVVGQTFFQYVNGWRIEAVKAELARPRSAARAILEIALECGFGSKSAFNEAFKRETGMSPSEYRKALPGSAVRSVPSR
jgi:AraC-like DNA-binding protein